MRAAAIIYFFTSVVRYVWLWRIDDDNEAMPCVRWWWLTVLDLDAGWFWWFFVLPLMLMLITVSWTFAYAFYYVLAAPSSPVLQNIFEFVIHLCVSRCAQIYTFETPILTAYSDDVSMAGGRPRLLLLRQTIHSVSKTLFYFLKQTNSIRYCIQCTSKK